LAGRIAIPAVPEWIDRQHLHVDRHRVHLLQTLLDDDEVLWNALDRRQHLVGRIAHQINGFVEIAVRANIHGRLRRRPVLHFLLATLPRWRREGNLSCKDYGRLK
jgi:hypothetical protein